MWHPRHHGTVDRRRQHEFGYFRRPSLVVVFLGACSVLAYRWRWQLTPVYVAAPMPVVGWLSALAYWMWPGWTVAAYVVAAVCAAVWVWHGLSRPYDRILGTAVAAVCLGWTFAVAVRPGTGSLYGLWVITWPIAGLFWWCGGAFRSGHALAQLRSRWANVVELAGIGSTTLIRVRDTSVGKVIEAELPGGRTQRELSRERLESALSARPGSVHLVKSKTNARRVTVHIVERDPWADGTELPHPAVAAATAIPPVAHAGHTHRAEPAGPTPEEVA
jgi:hypothetical protein